MKTTIKNDGITFLIITTIITLFLSVLFGLAGMRFSLALIFLFFLPFYLIFDAFNLGKDEKVIFSIISGLGFYSAAVYYIAFVFGSISISIIVSAILLYCLGIYIWYKKKSSVNTHSIN